MAVERNPTVENNCPEQAFALKTRTISVIGMFRQQPEARSHTVNPPHVGDLSVEISCADSIDQRSKTIQLASGPSRPPVSHCEPCQRVSRRWPTAYSPAFCPDHTNTLAKSKAAWKPMAKASEPVRRSVRHTNRPSRPVETKSSQRSCGFRK